MKVLEVRQTPYGLKRRRYDGGPGGEPLTTYEVPSAVLSRLGWKRIEKMVAAWHKHRITRGQMTALRKSILASPDVPAPELARTLGCTRSYVNQVRSRAKRK